MLTAWRHLQLSLMRDTHEQVIIIIIIIVVVVVIKIAVIQISVTAESERRNVPVTQRALPRWIATERRWSWLIDWLLYGTSAQKGY